MARFSLTLLGGFEATLASGAALSIPARKTRGLLAYLALRHGRRSTRVALASLLWEDRSDAQAGQSLRQALAGLRRGLPRTRPPVLVADHQAIALDVSRVDVDVLRFERLAAVRKPAALVEALTLYRGDLLEGVRLREAGFEQWLSSERDRLRGLAVDALERLSRHRLDDRGVEAGIQAGLRLLALDASQEAVHRALMRLYLGSGRRAAAVKQYDRCAEILRRDLGVEPDAATRTLRREASAAAPSRPAPAMPVVRAARPAARAESTNRLVGRDAEVAEARRALEAAHRGRGGFLAVSGEAGIGKSRLVAELTAWAARRDAWIVEARCFENEQILSFAPWVTVLRHERLQAALREVVEGDARSRTELARLLPELGRGSPDPIVEGDFLRIFEAVGRVVMSAATEHPLLLVLEDLHWADDMSIRLLDFIGRRCGATRLLLVATMRTEEVMDRGPARRFLEADGDGERTTLRLSPLSARETLALVEQLAVARAAAGDVARLGARVWRLSEGNPFVVVETMRALPAARRLDAMERLPLADRIRQIVLRRLDRLSPRSRKLVSVAAVIGREIEPALLRRAAGVSERAFADQVEELTRRRILHAAGDGLAFTHDYLREVSYAELLAPRRRLLHAAVARALEAHYAGRLEPHWTALGTHHSEAGAWAEAAGALRRAAAVAARRTAYDDAAALLDQAVAAADRLPGTREVTQLGVDLRFDLAGALGPLGEFERIEACIADAARMARSLDDERRLAWASTCQAGLLWQTGRPAEACEAAARARATGERLADRPLMMNATFHLGVTHALCARYADAETFLEELRRDVDRTPERYGLDMFPAAACWSWLAFIDLECGAFDRGLPRAQEALRLAEAFDHPYTIGIASWVLGMLHVTQGRHEMAIPVLERALRLAHDSRIQILRPIVTALLARAYAVTGRPVTGDLGVGETPRFCRAGTIYHASLRMTEGWTHMVVGRIAEAAATAEEVLASARQGQLPLAEASALRLLGTTLALREPADVERADGRYREALELAERLGSRSMAAGCRLDLGKLYRRAGRPEVAEEFLTTARTMFLDMDMPRGLAASEEELRLLKATPASA
jgi:DNA-binding SARP family transcriptional activator/tetratricopeptide (TPR) repeat protein